MAPPWTNAWDESKPADSDLANTIGSQTRQFKLDTRQRLDWQHVFNQNVNDDGGHRFVLIASAYHPVNTESFKASGFSLTGASAQSCVDIAGTWNTSGTPTAIKLNLLDSASNASSLLLDLQVCGVSKFKLDKSGNVTTTGVIGSAVAPVMGFGSTSTALATSYLNIAQPTMQITPSSAAKRVLIQCSISCCIEGKGAINIRVMRGAVLVREFVGIFNHALSADGSVGVSNTNVFLQCIDSPASASQQTYTWEAKYEGSPTAAYINGQFALSVNPTSAFLLQEIT